MKKHYNGLQDIPCTNSSGFKTPSPSIESIRKAIALMEAARPTNTIAASLVMDSIFSEKMKAAVKKQQPYLKADKTEMQAGALATFAGIPCYIDDTLEPGTCEARNSDGVTIAVMRA